MQDFKKGLLQLLLLFSIASSCTNRGDEKIVRFETKENLKKQTTEIQILSKGNVELLVIDTLLIVQKSNEPFIEIYSTNSHDLITKYGEHGEGPGKILFPTLIKIREFENNSPIINIYDLTKRVINKINIKNLLESKEPIVTEHTLPFTGAFLQYFYYADKDLFLGKTEGLNRFTHYDKKNDTIKYIPYIPKQNFDIDEDYLDFVYKSSVTVNKEKKLIAAFPLLLGSLDFFDLEGQYIKSTYFDSPIKFEKTIEEAKGNGNSLNPQFYIIDSDTDQNYIYGLNYNNPPMQENIKLNRNKIEVFDWNGTPIKEYILENESLSESFALDSKHNRFYTYCRNCEYSNIVYYNIK